MLLFLAACADPAPSAPADVAGPRQAIGVVWYDTNHNNQIDSDEQPANGVTVELGIANQLYRVDTATTTTNTGAFTLDLPEGMRTETAEQFAQITIETAHPQDPDRTVKVQHRHDVTIGGPAAHIPINEPAACDGPTLDQILNNNTNCGTVRLPDLVPLVEDFGQSVTLPVGAASTYTDTDHQPGTTLLRLSSATANLGNGPLHMIPGTGTGDRQPTWQRIWTDTNRYHDTPTGEFVFHPEHDHFHLDGFEQYRLLTTNGDPIATGDKISFCLLDSVQATPEPQIRGQGIFLDVVCEQAGQQQALNPGWADYYDASLADQWIDITGIEPGNYLVEIIVDPDNILIESDETNNRATFPVTVTATDLGAGDQD